MAAVEGEFPRPPGFEEYGYVDEAELAEFRSFMSGNDAAAPASEPATASSDWRGLADDRALSRRGRDEHNSGEGYKVNEQPAVSKPPGLVGEDSATVAITSWHESRAASQMQDSLLDEDTSFEQLGLSENLLRGVYEMGFVKPSKIQAAALPLIKGGSNMIGQAQNGSGKTATFSLALLSALDVKDERPQALVLCPTRELARQNESVISQLGQYLPVATLLVVPSQDRIQKYAKVHAIVGTPGKVMDMAKKRVIDVSSIKVFVLDEADMMLDQENNMGPQVTQIRALMQNDVQVLFFSATYPDDVRAFAENLVPRAVSIKVRKTELTLASVAQMYMRCEDEWDKFNKLTALYGAMNVGQSVIFVNQRKKAFQLAKWMRDAGFAVSLICGTQTSGEERMDPALRDHVMDEFRNCVTRVLIATDVLSRGIDVPQVTLVVNYELPINWTDRGVDMETYLHRVGRTGRFGLRGLAVNLLTDRERPMVDQICSFFACQIEQMDEDFEALEERLKILR
jgi:ATP-dependent RNA helicase DDX19/DBP5